LRRFWFWVSSKCAPPSASSAALEPRIDLNLVVDRFCLDRFDRKRPVVTAFVNEIGQVMVTPRGAATILHTNLAVYDVADMAALQALPSWMRRTVRFDTHFCQTPNGTSLFTACLRAVQLRADATKATESDDEEEEEGWGAGGAPLLPPTDEGTCTCMVCVAVEYQLHSHIG
jgi:hypothetical protein